MLLSISWRKILEQFDFVSARRFHNRELDLSAGHSRNLAGHFARLMRAMRKLKAENILPKFERALEIRNCDASMIGGDDLEFSHALKGGTRSPLRVARVHSASPTLIWHRARDCSIHLIFHCRDYFEFYRDRRGQRGHFDSRARWIRFAVAG